MMVSPNLCPPNTDRKRSKGGIELADVVRRFGSTYQSQYADSILPSQKRALWDIVACCTKELGGRQYQCNDCSESFWIYHSCRNRACPKCHGKQTQKWLEERHAELLPCDYFHAVATVPSELRSLFKRHQKVMYGLFMRVSAKAVKELCAVKRHLGALPGILSVLHTGNGKLNYHPHVHMLITGGGVTSDGEHWEPARGTFLVPVLLLSRKIAALFRKELKKELPRAYASIPASVWGLEWVSFCKHYGCGNDAVLKYLSRYVFRTAISNARILEMDETHVTFRWKNRKTDSWQIQKLTGVEFLRRFLQHVLPKGFHKCRYYGLWHTSKRHLSNRAWLLLILHHGVQGFVRISIADLVEELNKLPNGDAIAPDGDRKCPCCPNCGSDQATLIDIVHSFGMT